MRLFLTSVAIISLATFGGVGLGVAAGPPQLVTILDLPGESTDLTKLSKGSPGGANVNRNGFFSDLFYDNRTDKWYALSDRGAGGGTLSYETRVQRFTVDHDAKGAISNYKIDRTIRFRDQDGMPFNGLNPRDLNGDASELGNSFDPEGIVVGQAGHMYVSDEYGPSVYEFDPSGQFIRGFTPPANLLPVEPDGDVNLVDGRPITVKGRQDNRGYEGLAINQLRTKLYAILQDPLLEEGARTNATATGVPEGRRGRNVRIVEYDIKSGKSERQFVYQLDTLADINSHIDPLDPMKEAFTATAQGRSIGASSIYGISNTEFLVLERDNRGLGVDYFAASPPNNKTSLHKRIYKISIAGATDVSNISLTPPIGNVDAGYLPVGVNAVSKVLFLDLLTEIDEANHWIPEKIEGFAPGPKLSDGSRLYVGGTDNDYSVTQNTSNVQFNVCVETDDDGNVTGPGSTQVAIDASCPNGTALIPGVLMSFKGN